MRRELPFGMEKTGREELASSVTEEEGAFLTSVFLSGRTDAYRPEMAENAAERGLIYPADGRMLLSEAAMDTISPYPLLGRNAERKPYPEAFFPALLSAAASGALPSDASHWKRTLSSLIAPAFPSAGREEIVQSASAVLHRFAELGIADDDGSTLTLDREEAERFMALPEEEKLALMISPPSASSLAYSVFLAFQLSGVEKDKAGECIDMIGRITGCPFPDRETLFALPILAEDDGIVSGRRMRKGKAESIVVSSDFTISYEGCMPASIYLFAELSRCDVTSEWRITRNSMKAAFSLGLTPEDVKDTLERLSQFPLPEMLYPRISSWYSSFSSVRMERAMLLYTDDRNGRIVDALPTMRMHILGKLGENVFLMDPTSEALWRRALENAGFDMLGPASGPAFVQKDRKISQLPSPSSPFPQLPEKRRIPFARARREEMMEGAQTELRKALIASGFITDADEPTPELDEANGLYYQEKLHIVHSACQGAGKLYLEDIDGHIAIGMAEKGQDGDTVIVSGRAMSISRMWKAALLPLGTVDWYTFPSESNRQNAEDDIQSGA